MSWRAAWVVIPNAAPSGSAVNSSTSGVPSPPACSTSPLAASVGVGGVQVAPAQGVAQAAAIGAAGLGLGVLAQLQQPVGVEVVDDDRLVVAVGLDHGSSQALDHRQSRGPEPLVFTGIWARHLSRFVPQRQLAARRAGLRDRPPTTRRHVRRTRPPGRSPAANIDDRTAPGPTSRDMGDARRIPEPDRARPRHEPEPLWREAVGHELREERRTTERTLADVAAGRRASRRSTSPRSSAGSRSPARRSSARSPARSGCGWST